MHWFRCWQLYALSFYQLSPQPAELLFAPPLFGPRRLRRHFEAAVFHDFAGRDRVKGSCAAKAFRTS
jgi:hypothetical protein